MVTAIRMCHAAQIKGISPDLSLSMVFLNMFTTKCRLTPAIVKLFTISGLSRMGANQCRPLVGTTHKI